MSVQAHINPNVQCSNNCKCTVQYFSKFTLDLHFKMCSIDLLTTIRMNSKTAYYIHVHGPYDSACMTITNFKLLSNTVHCSSILAIFVNAVCGWLAILILAESLQ